VLWNGSGLVILRTRFGPIELMEFSGVRLRQRPDNTHATFT